MIDVAEPAAAGDDKDVKMAVASVRSPKILGLCLSSRRNLCIHPEVSRFDNRNKGDASCANLNVRQWTPCVAI
jgi:hypothetical protein